MLSKFAKEQDINTTTQDTKTQDTKTPPISVSPSTGYASWFTIWNTKKEQKQEEDNKSDTSEIFQLSEDETSKLPVDIENSEHENQDTETDNSDDESSNSEELVYRDKYLGSKRCMINDNELPYNYSLLYRDIKKTKSICEKIVNNNIQKWNNTSEAFKLYVISVGSMYLGIAEPVALFTITYCFLSKFDEKNNIDPLSDFDEEETDHANYDESSDCAADSEQD